MLDSLDLTKVYAGASNIPRPRICLDALWRTSCTQDLCAPAQRICIVRGSDLRVLVTVKDEHGESSDLSAILEARFGIYTHSERRGQIIEVTKSGGDIFLGGLGVIYFPLRAAQTNMLRRSLYHYDLELTNAEGWANSSLTGTMIMQ